MTAVTYTAKRSITSGHVEDTEYTIDLRCNDIVPGKDVGKSESRAMDGSTETVAWRNLQTWNIVTAAVVGDEHDLVLEFLESVLFGETFTFDEFGSASSADNPITVVIDGVYRRQRAVRQGGGGQDDYFRFNFQIRQVS